MAKKNTPPVNTEPKIVFADPNNTSLRKSGKSFNKPKD